MARFLSQSRQQLNSDRSSSRANIFKHIFIAEVLKELWFCYDLPVSVLMSEVDDDGYDVVLAAKNNIRFIQLKSSANLRKQRIHSAIADKDGGCVLFMHFFDTKKPQELTIVYYYLDDFSVFRSCARSKDPRSKKQSKNSFDVPINKFMKIGSLRELVGKLFPEQLRKDTGA